MLAGCTGNQAGLDDYLGTVECSYKIDKVTNPNEVVKKAIGSTFIDNCDHTDEGTVGAAGTYNRSREWTVSAEAGVAFMGMSVSGGGSYGEGEEKGQEINGTWTVPGGQKAQAVFGQPHEVSDGVVHAKVRAGAGEAVTSDERDLSVTNWKIPNWGARQSLSAEIIPCDQEFTIPTGPADAFSGSSKSAAARK